MLSNKPEFIDPEEQNLIYYYDRNKRKKRLAKNKRKLPKKRFLLFNSSKGKIILIVFYLFMLLFLYLSSSDKAKDKANSKMLNGIKHTLSSYVIPNKNRISFQILFKNKSSEEKKVDVKIVRFSLYNKSGSEIIRGEIKINNFLLPIGGIKNFIKELYFRERPDKLRVEIYLLKNKKVVLAKYNLSKKLKLSK